MRSQMRGDRRCTEDEKWQLAVQTHGVLLAVVLVAVVLFAVVLVAVRQARRVLWHHPMGQSPWKAGCRLRQMEAQRARQGLR